MRYLLCPGSSVGSEQMGITRSIYGASSVYPLQLCLLKYL